MKTPTPIIVTFTEEDRQNADEYLNSYHCLLATALRRMGFEDPVVGGFNVHLHGVYYAFGLAPILKDYDESVRPFYSSSVVGQTLTLIPVL